MSTIRISKRDRFTVVDQSMLNDERLSYRARGVLVWLLDKPDDWSVRSNSIAGNGLEGRDAIRTALSELEAAGYLVRERKQTDKGFWTTETMVYEQPLDIDGNVPRRVKGRSFSDSFKVKPTEDGKPVVGEPVVGEPAIGEPVVGNSGAITNTNNKDLQQISSQVSDDDDLSKEVGLKNAERLCNMLALLIEENGSKKPKVTDAWITDMDRLIRLDERTPEQVENAIRWSQRDDFWKSNILSPKKLREKYDQLRLVAIREMKSKDATPKINDEETIAKSWGE